MPRPNESRNQEQQCAFCESPANSPEHYFPRWLLKLLHRTKDSVIRESSRDGTVVNEYTGQGAAVVTVTVCQVCNLGWMNRLETSTSPLLKDLIYGKPLKMTQVDRTRLSIWLLKTAMVYESMHRTTRHFSKEEFVALREGTTPNALSTPFPRQMTTWIACNEGMQPLFSVGSAGNSQPPDSGRQGVPCFAFTFAAGRLVLQLFAARDPTEELSSSTVNQPFDLAYDRRFDGIPKRLFPSLPNLLGWPLDDVLDDRTQRLDDFARRWVGPVPSVND